MAAGPDAVERTDTTTTTSDGRFARPGSPSTAGGMATKSGKATAAMVPGIAGLVLAVLFWPLGIVVSIAGLVISVMARSEVRRTGASNAGMATAGLVCSIVGVALSVLFLAVFGAVLAGS